MAVQLTSASAWRGRRSQSLTRRRAWVIQDRDLSTLQRRGRTLNPARPGGFFEMRSSSPRVFLALVTTAGKIIQRMFWQSLPLCPSGGFSVLEHRWPRHFVFVMHGWIAQLRGREALWFAVRWTGLPASNLTVSEGVGNRPGRPPTLDQCLWLVGCVVAVFVDDDVGGAVGLVVGVDAGAAGDGVEGVGHRVAGGPVEVAGGGQGGSGGEDD